MNSIIDNPNLGDERNFVRIRRVGDPKFGDNIIAEIDAEYEVEIYYHNNASSSLNADGSGVANNVRASSVLPLFIKGGELGFVSGVISAENTNPKSVWDETTITTEVDIFLSYVPDSAIIHSNGSIDGKLVEQNDLFSAEGALIGYSNEYWSIIPGCNEYAGYVSYRFRVEKMPNYELHSSIKRTALDLWETAPLDVTTGERLWVALDFINENDLDYKIFSQLPIGAAYVPETAYIVNEQYPNGRRLSDGIDTGTGVLITSDLSSSSIDKIVFQVEFSDSPLPNYVINSFVMVNGVKGKDAVSTLTLANINSQLVGVSAPFFSMDNPIIYIVVLFIAILLEEIVRRKILGRQKKSPAK